MMNSRKVAVSTQELRELRHWFKQFHQQRHINDYHKVTNQLKLILNRSYSPAGESQWVDVQDIVLVSKAINDELFSDTGIADDQFTNVLRMFTRVLSPLLDMVNPESEEFAPPRR